MTSVAAVLLIEDNPGDARLVREQLGERFGEACTVHTAETLAGGLRWLESSTADVILLDLSLPDSQGLDTYYSVHACAPATPIVILSGHDDDDTAVEAVRVGAGAYLAKQRSDGVVLARAMRQAVERGHIERALRESEARYRTIVETAEEGILQLDVQRRIRFVNERMARMVSRRVDQLLGRPFAELLEPTSLGLAEQLLSDCEGGGRRVCELHYRREDGTRLWALTAAGSIRSFGADTLDTIVMLTDIGGRVRAELELAQMARELEQRVEQRTAQLKAANAELERFNHAVAHDLRSPLSAIIGFAQLLEQRSGAGLSDDARQQLQMIQRGAAEMNELVGGLLALSRIDRTQLRQSRLDLSAMALELLQRLRAAEPQHPVEAVVEPGLSAWGDAALVRDLLANLLGNAWKYSHKAERPWLRFGTVPVSSGEVVYVVQDNGVGFDMAGVTTLFQPFVRLPSSEGYEGSGMGLVTVRRIVERHGGRIWAESQPGVRTSFFFTLGSQGSPQS